MARAWVPRSADLTRGIALADGGREALVGLAEVGGRVLATYRQVVNVESNGGRRLLAVHLPHVPASPFSLLVAERPLVGWPAPGSLAHVRGQLLQVGHLSVDLRGVRRLERTRTTLRADAGALLSALAPLIARASVPAAPLRRLAADRSLEAALALLGLGQGATPAGDDALIGFLGVWLRWQPADPAPMVLGRALAELAPHRTTRLAAEFYYHFGRGRLSQPLDALLSAPPAELGRAAAELAGLGATSGRDMLAGVAAYLASLPSPVANASVP